MIKSIYNSGTIIWIDQDTRIVVLSSSLDGHIGRIVYKVAGPP